MDLRRKGEGARKLKRDVDRQKVPFFDLRGENEADSRPRRDGRISPAGAETREDGRQEFDGMKKDDQGRERHRVEVGTPVQSKEIDILPLYDENGRQRRRIVRGNAPGRYRGTESRGQEPQTRWEEAEEREWNSAGRSDNYYRGQADRAAADYRSRAERTDTDLRGRAGRTDMDLRGRAERTDMDLRGRAGRTDMDLRGRTGLAGVDSGASSAGRTVYSRGSGKRRQTAYQVYSGSGADTFDSRIGEGSGAYDPDESLYMEGEEYPYAPEDEWTDDLQEDTSERTEDPGHRRRRWKEAREQRERELRRIYLSIGAVAGLVLIVLILVVPRLFGRSEKPVEDGSSVAAGAETADKDRETRKTEDTADQGSAGQKQPVRETADQESGNQETPEQVIAQTPADGGTAAEEKSSEGITAAESFAGTDPAETAGRGQDAQNGTESSGITAGTAEDGTGVPGKEVGEESSAAAPQSGGEYAFQDDWRFILVNKWNPLPEGYSIEVETLPSGESVARGCFSDLSRMLEDCRKEGGTPIVCSSYRPHEKQIRLFDEQVRSLMSKGMDRKAAEEEAGMVVARPGTSEHELGLAVDICDTEYQQLDRAQEDTKTQKWLMEHCWDYGFILRYPESKSAITGIIYEPWHYRYVGVEAALEIRNQGVCLEEYLRNAT